jgi:ABC-2 type transport system permease protein
MLLKLFLFEYRFFVKQPSFYITLAVFFMLPFLAMSLNRINIAGANTLKNSSYSIVTMSAFFGAFAMFLVINFIANTAIRNSVTRMDEILYCKPIEPFQYQMGRFLGSFAVVLTVFAMVPLGLFVATWMPWVDSELMGENFLASYVISFIYLSVPTLFTLSCCFYALAVRFQSMMAVNLLALGLFIAYDLSDLLFITPGFRHFAALMDPFGLRTFAEVSRYWTMFEKNNEVLELSGVFLQNRVVWLTIGVGIMVFFGRMNAPLVLRVPKSLGQDRAEKMDFDQPEPDQFYPVQSKPPATALIDTRNLVRQTLWLSFMTRTLFEIKQVVVTPSFLIVMIMTTTLILAMLTIPTGMFGTPNWPLTQEMVRLIQAAMSIVVMIVITFYSAEVIWREREAGIGDVIDSMPVPNLSFWLSKLLAVWCVVILLVLFCIGLTASYQLISGFYLIDLQQYFISLFFFSVLPWCLLAILAFFLQAISSNKYMGMSLFVLFILSSFAMEPLGLAHNMFRFSRAPVMTYSDMNGYGWFMTTQFWYMLYWSALSLALAIISYGLWHRGPVTSVWQRGARALNQIGRVGSQVFGISLAVFLFSGGYIHYNTSILNDYQSESEAFDEQMRYEQQYAAHSDDPVPVITSVATNVDIFPYERVIVASADLVVVNQSERVIKKFLVSMPRYTPRVQITIKDNQNTQTLDTLGENVAGPYRTYWFVLASPMSPGEQRHVTIALKRENVGFVDRDADVVLVRNGTFINNMELFPQFGYQSNFELVDRNERRRRNIPPAKLANDLEDSRYHTQNILGNSADFISFEAIVSTHVDQIAIAPGYLERQWIEGERAFFHYKMDAPIANYYAFLSAELEVVKTQHDGVAVAVYHHAGHEQNVPRMIESIIDSLDYYGASFGPYQHRQARIIEFPGYRNFAQSFANTIPYSERIGFFSDLRDVEGVDSVYFVTAHEMAHQWWGGQVMGADVQGNTMLSESLAHYSALRVTENRYGKIHSRKILLFELDRYLRERTQELIAELPWMRVGNQPYIHYRKGVVAMNSIYELLGESRINEALKAYLSVFKFQENPYATSLDLQSFFNRSVTIPEQKFINNLFEQITLYDLKLLSIDSSPTASGTFDITLNVEAQLLKADGEGQEKRLPLEEYVDLGLSMKHPEEFLSESDLSYLGRHKIVSGDNRIRINVSENPKYALIDPYVRLIDKELEDNYQAF